MAEVVVSERAADWLRDAEPDVRDQVRKKLREASDFPEHYLKSLSGSPFHRLRVGDYRVIAEGRREDDELFVRKIGHRRNVYE